MASFKAANKCEEELIAPYMYIAGLSGKHIRTRLVHAFNHWLRVPLDKVQQICEVVEMLHNASLMVDDIEDSSVLRRGLPVTHSIYGVASTINSSNFVYFYALKACNELGHQEAVRIFTEQMIELHKGQGMDIYWRDSTTCPTEEEYVNMTIKKTGGLFLLPVGLLQLFSSNKTDYTDLLKKIAVYFQIRDDYANLASIEYEKLKSFAEDLTEGKFSFPIIHAVRHSQDGEQVVRILRQRTTCAEVKKYCVELLRRGGSLDYTCRRLETAADEILDEIHRHGGNEELTELIRSLRIIHAGLEEREDERR